MGQVAPHHLLGDAREPELILLAGPNYSRIQEIIRKTSFAFDMRPYTYDMTPEGLKAEAVRKGEPIVIISSLPEVEGRLDRSAFDGRLTDLAYAADRVIYVGMTGAALVHPIAPGTRQEIRNGHLVVSQRIDVVPAGQKVVGLTVDRL